MKRSPWVIAAVPLVLAVLFTFGPLMVPPERTAGFDIDGFGRITVQAGGRFQPISSVARNNLQMVTGRTTYRMKDDSKTKFSATYWMLMLLSDHSEISEYQFIRIDDPVVRQYFKLTNRPGWWRYSIDDLRPRAGEFTQLYHNLSEMKRAERPLTADQTAYYEFGHTLGYVTGNRSGIGFFDSGDKEGWTTIAAIDQQNAPELKERFREKVIADVRREVFGDPRVMEQLHRNPQMLTRIIEEETESRLRSAIASQLPAARRDFSPAAACLQDILDAFRANDAETFNERVADYLQYYDGEDGRRSSRIRAELFLNRWDPFFSAEWSYVLVMVLVFAHWLTRANSLRWSAYVLMMYVTVIHTVGILLRMYVAGRPPVTNLYSSAVFIGWGCVIFCHVVEAIYKNGLSLAVGGTAGFATLQVARFLSQNGDTLDPLVAVLDTNFWLATHVTIVTLGYSATYLAGLLGIIFVIAGFFTTTMQNRDNERELYRMMYGVTCFATLLSFVGTVLGGIWADESWGRFWGWDPKENGAVLIVLWNALALHARWAGLVKVRGFAVLLIFGNIVTTWSWFGTNQLGVGLHAYGFSSKLAIGCTVTWVVHSLLIFLGVMPKSIWASYNPSAESAAHRPQGTRSERRRGE